MGSPITVSLWTLGGVGIMLQFFAWQRLRREGHILQRMREEAYALDPEQLHDWMSKAATDPDSLSMHHLRLVQRAVGSQHPPSAAELVEATEEAEASHWWHILPNLMLAVTLVLGLAGTMLILQQVLGGESLQKLIKASTGLSSAPTSLEVRQFTQTVTESITAIYQGFGGAFSASLTGIAWTVVLTAFNLILLRPAQVRFASLLHRATLEILLPKFVPRDDRLFEQLEVAGASLRQTGEDMGMRLTAMCDAIGASIGQFTEQATKTKEFSNAVDRSSRALEKTLEKFSQVFSQGGPFQIMADHMSRQSTQLVSSTEHLKTSVQQVGESFREPLSGLQQHTQSIQQEVSALKVEAHEVLRKLEQTVGILETVQAHKVREEERVTREGAWQNAVEDRLQGLHSSSDKTQAAFARWEVWMGLMQTLSVRAADAAEQNQQTAKAAQTSLERMQAVLGVPASNANAQSTSAPNVLAVMGTMLSLVERLEGSWTKNNATLSALEALVRECKAFSENPQGYWLEQEGQKLAWIAEIARRLPDGSNGHGNPLQEVPLDPQAAREVQTTPERQRHEAEGNPSQRAGVNPAGQASRKK